MTDIPKEARQAFCAQRRGAKRRGIPFKLSLEEWWAWWQYNDSWERRGYSWHNLVMARFGDQGPYSLTNIYCTTQSQNSRDTDWNKYREKRRAAQRRRWERYRVEHLRQNVEQYVKQIQPWRIIDKHIKREQP